MGLVKAIIEIDPNDRGPDLPPFIPVQFNPGELNMTKGAQIAEIALPGIDSPILQFVRGQTQTLSMELFFDTTRLGMGIVALDVRTLTEPVFRLVKIQSNTHAPPRVRFFWGAGISFKGIVDNVQQKFMLFNPVGIPLRATLTVSFKEYKVLEDQLKELNLQSADHTKRRQIKRKETLAQIAWEEYGDPAQWRRIYEDPDNADVLPNPRRLTPGVQIKIPMIDVFRGGAK
jgi:nucleoid-associated protein YgaU